MLTIERILMCKTVAELKGLDVKFETVKEILRTEFNFKAGGWKKLLEVIEQINRDFPKSDRRNQDEENRREQQRKEQEQRDRYQKERQQREQERYQREKEKMESETKNMSETDKIIFNLLKLDGMNRVIALGITRKHFSDKELAKSWKRNMMNKVHPDKTSNPLAQEAFYKVTEIYQQMAR